MKFSWGYVVRTLIFLLITLGLTACGQGLEPVGEARSLRELTRIGVLFSAKPKSASEFVHNILRNRKLIINNNKLKRRIRKYVKQGGSLNDEVDVYGNTMLNKALRAGKENFATILIENNADKNQALRALLPPAGSTREISSHDWSEVSWLIERGASLDLLDSYIDNLITGADFDAEVMKRAIELGADKQLALAKALQEKSEVALEVLAGLANDQQVFDQALQARDYGAVGMLLKARESKGIEIDADPLLIKALQEGEKELFGLAIGFGASKGRIIKKSLQDKDYDTLNIFIKEESTSSLGRMGILVEILQTKDDQVVDLVLDKYGKDKKNFLNWALSQFDVQQGYDTAEFIVAKGGDATMALQAYLHEIYYQSSRAKFDLTRIQRMVALGAEPSKLDLKTITRRVMEDIVEHSVGAQDHMVLEFLFANMDSKTITAMDESRMLLLTLVRAKEQEDIFAEHIRKHRIDTSDYQPADKDFSSSVRDSLIALLQEHGVSL